MNSTLRFRPLLALMMVIAATALLFTSAAHAGTMRVQAGNGAQSASAQVVAHYRLSPVAYANGRLKLAPKPRRVVVSTATGSRVAHRSTPIAYADGRLMVRRPHRRFLAHAN